MRRPCPKQSTGVKSSPRATPSETILSRDPPGGRKRRLVHVAPATAARPTGRSAGAHPEIMSQKARKSAAREAAARLRPTADIARRRAQGSNPARAREACAIARLRPAKEPQAGNPPRVVAGVARHPRLQSACCDAAQSYHVPRNRGSIGRPASAPSESAAPVEERLWKGHAQNESAVMAPEVGDKSRASEPRAIDGTKNEGGRDRPPNNSR